MSNLKLSRGAIACIVKPKPTQLGDNWHPKIEVVQARRRATEQERNDWYKSPASKGMTSSGETKLFFDIITTKISVGTIVVIVNARCAPTIGTIKFSKQSQIALSDGTLWFVNREHLTIV